MSSPVIVSRSSRVCPVGAPPTSESVPVEVVQTPPQASKIQIRRMGAHRLRQSTTNGAAEKTIGQRCIKLRKRVSSSCRVLSSDFSEVCFVSGIITAFIGSLVAISGIFTRNQARTRLYMEGFGCGMVILGVLVVFFSLKLRASKDFELNRFSNLFNDNRHNHHQQRQQLLARHRQQQQQHHHHQLNSPAVGSPEPLSAVVVSLPPIETTSFTSFNMMSSDPADELTQSNDEDSVSLAGSLCGPLNQGQAWTPCMAQDSKFYPDGEPNYGHERATIEAALSIVLTAATIAGFRPTSREFAAKASVHQLSGEPTTTTTTRDLGDGPGATIRLKHEHFCCLHHTVQHKLQARKWINCLRVAAAGTRDAPDYIGHTQLANIETADTIETEAL